MWRQAALDIDVFDMFQMRTLTKLVPPSLEEDDTSTAFYIDLYDAGSLWKLYAAFHEETIDSLMNIGDLTNTPLWNQLPENSVTGAKNLLRF